MRPLDSLAERIAGLDRPLLLALDVDGTISPIVRDPDRARIPDPTIAVLRELANTPGVVLALITGRDFDSLRRMEQLDGIWRAVEHGGLVLGPNERPGQRLLPERQQKALERFADWVAEHASDAFVERKPQAIAVHVRGIAMTDPKRAERLMSEADALATGLGLHVRRGKALREAEAVPSDKGVALRTIFERSGARSVFFAGDDLTDLPAIAFASEHGVGTFVGSNEARATPSTEAVILDGVADVEELLRGLVAHLGR